MANPYFQFRQFTIHHDRCAMKVTTDACLFGAWCAERVRSRELGLTAEASAQAGVRSLEPAVKKVLDIGAGSGLLSLMLAQKVSSVRIDSIEFDQEAFEQATENVSASPWPEKIKIIKGDVRSYTFTHQYDIIISNPPFYENELRSDDVKKNMARHNESLLLPELLEIIKKLLAPEGLFYLLLPYKRYEEIRELLFNNDLAIREIRLVRPSPGHGYFRMMMEGQLKRTSISNSGFDEISIRDGNNDYSPAFVQLLKDYYLYL